MQGSGPGDSLTARMRYAVYDPRDPRKGKLLPDPELGQIILGQGDTITKALHAATAPSGAVVWDREQSRVAYTVPEAASVARSGPKAGRKSPR